MMSLGNPCDKCAHDDDDDGVTPYHPSVSVRQINKIRRRLKQCTLKLWKDQPLVCQPKNEPKMEDPQTFPNTEELPIHLTLFGLPAELRIIIYKFLFANGGTDVLRQQLRSGHIGYLNTTNNVNTLLVCRQFYNEAFSIAYQHTYFYYFKNYAFSPFDTLLTRLRLSQMENLRKVAVWTNPYLFEDYFDNVPDAIHLTSITICCNFMSSRMPEPVLLARARWICNIANRVKSLRQLYFRTGCRVSTATDGPTDDDCGFSADLRRALEQRSKTRNVKGCTLGSFDRDTKIATLQFDGLGASRPRSVELMVASVYEVDL